MTIRRTAASTTPTPSRHADAAAPGASLATTPGAARTIPKLAERYRRAAPDLLGLPAGQIVALALLRGRDSGKLIATLRRCVAIDPVTPTAEDYFALVARDLAILAGRALSLTPAGICAGERLARALPSDASWSASILARTPRRRRRVPHS
jgi:hypothetical protein